MTFSLTGKQRRFLRALGHALKPVVQVGHAGLTEPVLKAIDQALTVHELIKIKVASEASEGADALAEPIERAAGSSVAQVVGRTLLVYRGRKKKPSIVLPDEHQAGSVNAVESDKPPAPGRHLAKKRGRGKKHAASPRTEANRRSEASRREGKSRRAPTRPRAKGAD